MKKKNTMRKLLRYLKKYWLLLALSLLFAALTVAMTRYLPILIGQAVDLIVAPGKVEFSAIASLLLKMGVLIGATALSQWIMNACNNRITTAPCVISAAMPLHVWRSFRCAISMRTATARSSAA